MKFLYSGTSIKYLQKLERSVSRKIIEAIDKLPFEGDVYKLKGKKTKNIFRLRLGTFFHLNCYSFCTQGIREQWDEMP